MWPTGTPAFCSRARQNVGNRLHILRRINLADRHAINVWPDDCGQVVFEQTSVQRVDTRDDQHSPLRQLGDEGGRQVARIGFFFHGHGVFHVRDKGIWGKASRLGQHISAVPRHE